MDDYFFVFKHFDSNSGMINHSMIIGNDIGMAIDEFAEDGAQLIRGYNKANAHTQNASEGPRADKFTSDNAKGLRDPLFEMKRITDQSHNIRAPSFANSSIEWMPTLYRPIEPWWLFCLKIDTRPVCVIVLSSRRTAVCVVE
jgi:hypothetical protein